MKFHTRPTEPVHIYNNDIELPDLAKYIVIALLYVNLCHCLIDHSITLEKANYFLTHLNHNLLFLFR